VCVRVCECVCVSVCVHHTWIGVIQDSTNDYVDSVCVCVCMCVGVGGCVGVRERECAL